MTAAENHANRANKQRGVAFGRANTSCPVNCAPGYDATATIFNILPQVETYMENISADDTNNNRTIEALVDSTYHLTQKNAV